MIDPGNPSPPIEPTPADPNAAESGDARILVVDDELHIRTSFAQVLRFSRYHVDVAASGEEALARLAAPAAAYDLMLLDLKMPGVPGTAVLREAHARYPRLLIVVLTAHADLSSAILAVRSGAVAYLRKPASLAQIIETVRHALRERDDLEAEQRRFRQALVHAAEAFRAVGLGPDAEGSDDASAP